MAGTGSSESEPMMQLDPQFLHSYLSPFPKPGVSQVILHVGQVVKGRLGFPFCSNELSVLIVASSIRNDDGRRIGTIT